jgi:hypothetical protein
MYKLMNIIRGEEIFAFRDRGTFPPQNGKDSVKILPYHYSGTANSRPRLDDFEKERFHFIFTSFSNLFN